MAKVLMQKAGGFVSEFRRFAVKGNALELAVAVVIGTAFSGVVNSLVADIMTPLLGFLTGNVDLKTLSLALRPDIIVRYGAFFQTIFNFLVISVSVFVVFKFLAAARERLFHHEEEQKVPPHEKPHEERLLEEIRDLLKEKLQ